MNAQPTEYRSLLNEWRGLIAHGRPTGVRAQRLSAIKRKFQRMSDAKELAEKERYLLGRQSTRRTTSFFPTSKTTES